MGEFSLVEQGAVAEEENLFVRVKLSSSDTENVIVCQNYKGLFSPFSP